MLQNVRFNFQLDAKGAVSSVRVPMEPSVAAIEFTRVPEAAAAGSP
jgi:hypothetical protein